MASTLCSHHLFIQFTAERAKPMLFINNDVVAKVLTMKDTIEALENSYRQMVTKEAVCRPRVDIQIPTSDENKIYQWGTMEGGSQSGYFAIRMKSDVIFEQEYNG